MAYYQRKTNRASTPTKYSSEMGDRAFRLALIGLNNREIALGLGIAEQTLDLWIATRGEFKEMIDLGRVQADAKVAESFYQRAIGYSHPDVHIMANRVKEYDKEGHVIKEYNQPLMIPITKHYPPDAFAANKWLTMRQKKYWAETTKIEHTVKGEINVNFLTSHLSNKNLFSMDDLKGMLSESVKSIEQKQLSTN